jgi:hypothetical protein
MMCMYVLYYFNLKYTTFSSSMGPKILQCLGPSSDVKALLWYTMHAFCKFSESSIYKRTDENPCSEIAPFLNILKLKWLSCFSDVAFKYGFFHTR